MFENLVSQPVSELLASDIEGGSLPNSVLFCGPEASGKLTAALEVARVLGCSATKKGEWTCECPFCLQNKALTSSNLLLIGPRDCALEICAAKDTLLAAYRQNARHLKAARYLFIRSIRKLTIRFNGMLWRGDKDLNKIGSVMEPLTELLEKIDFPRELPPYEETERLCLELTQKALRLEKDFMYDSIPIAHIRNMEEWAHIKASEGKKTVIIENADRMLPGVRNALLKILEEPPEDCVFILLTAKRNAVMPTILSRVRTYSFNDRPLSIQSKVVRLVFHNETFQHGLFDYLMDYLPVPSVKIREEASAFVSSVSCGRGLEPVQLVKNCGGFEPRIELRLFLGYIAEELRPLMHARAGTEAYSAVLDVLRSAWENVTMYNQTPAAALEGLVRELTKINVTNQRVFQQAVQRG